MMSESDQPRAIGGTASANAARCKTDDPAATIEVRKRGNLKVVDHTGVVVAKHRRSKYSVMTTDVIPTRTLLFAGPPYESAISKRKRSDSREIIRRFRNLGPDDQQAIIDFLKQL